MNASKAAIRNWTRAQSRTGRRSAAPVVLLGLIGCIAALFQAWCVARILATALIGTLGTLAGPLWLPLAGFSAASVLRAGLQIAGEVLSARAGRTSRARLRDHTLTRILSDGPALLRRTHSGALAALLVDRIEAVDGFFARYLPAATLAATIPALVIVAAALAQPFAGIVLFLCGISVPLMQAAFGIGAATASRRQFQAMSRLQTRFVDRMRGIATIVLAGRADDEARRLSSAADELRVRTMRVLRVAFLSSAGLDCAMAVAIVAIALHDRRLLVHAQLVQAGGHKPFLIAPLLVSKALFALLLVPEFFAPLRSFALAYQDRMQASACAEALADLPDPEPEPEPQSGSKLGATPFIEPLVASKPVPAASRKPVALAFEDVTFAWDKARGATIDAVSFHVAAGETLLLVGPSGSGKSTIIELLLGFIRPDQGRITLDGADLRTLGPAALAASIGWIGQRPVLFAGTLRENILFARPDADQASLDEALRVASLESVVAALPAGLDTVIGEGGYGLSGGQAQRVAIARAMLRDAPLLLLDEPTAHLDPDTERAVFESLRLLARNRTVLLVSHSEAAHGMGGSRLDLRAGRVAVAEPVA